jgi:hypothetical protein
LRTQMSSDSPSVSRANQPHTLLGLLGYFFLVGAIALLAGGAWRVYRDATIARQWIDADATIRRCVVLDTSVFKKNGGGFVYSLKCELSVPLGGAANEVTMFTTSTRSDDRRTAMYGWTRRHRSGSSLRVKVNPEYPDGIAVVDPLPIPQFPRARDALIGAVYFALAGIPLVIFGVWRERTLHSARAQQV